MIDAPTSSAPPPAPRGDSDLLDLLLTAGGQAPPWAPALPWTVQRDGTALLLRLHALREEVLSDPANREVVMACGAALENLRIASRHFGRDLQVARWPGGDDDPTVAALTPGEAQEPRHEDLALFAALARSGGGAPLAAPRRGVSPALVAVLRHAARCEGGWLDVVADDARRELVGDLESDAVTIGDAERGVRSLLTLRLGRERTTTGSIEMEIAGGPSLANWLAALGADVHESNRWGGNRAATARGSTVTAPILAILGASSDTPSGWLTGGAALQRVLLHAKVQGLSATFLNEPLHHPLLRDALRSMLFAGGAPQAIVRFDFDERGHQPERTQHSLRSRSAA